jgi:hypothetical protein
LTAQKRADQPAPIARDRLKNLLYVQYYLTFNPASRTDVPKPQDGALCAVLLTCAPNPLRSIFVLGSWRFLGR